MAAIFRNLILFKLKKFAVEARALEEVLSAHSLQACGNTEAKSFGWVRPKGKGHPFVHQHLHHLLITMGVEEKLLPGSVVDRFVLARAAEIEEREGHKPGRKVLREIRDQVEHELLPRAFSIGKNVDAWIDSQSGLFVVNAGSEGDAEDLISYFGKQVSTDDFVVGLLRTVNSPASVMTQWLASGEVPSSFMIDRDCELKGSGDEKDAIRYVNHDLGAKEIPEYIAAGKTVTKLALTWQGKISFVLTDKFHLKKVTPLDLLKEENINEDQFDGDFAMMTGEFPQLLCDLIDAMGGVPDETATS